MKRNCRKPLIVMSPKALLRHKGAVSTLTDLTDGTFMPVIDDPARQGAPEAGPALDPAKVTRVCLCSGKVYYTLLHERRERALDSIALVRVEQLYPFAQKEIQAILTKYAHVKEFCWVQEEPRNRGAWRFMHEKLEPMLPETAVLTYVGRDEAASPATGSVRLHQVEEEELLAAALELPPRAVQIHEPLSPKEAAAKSTPVSD
jgi:2-oxoglutarate dehydrogenase E1 component